MMELVDNFNFDYASEMNPAEWVLWLKAGHKIPTEWETIENYKTGLKIFGNDPNASFFYKHRKLLESKGIDWKQ